MLQRNHQLSVNVTALPLTVEPPSINVQLHYCGINQHPLANQNPEYDSDAVNRRIVPTFSSVANVAIKPSGQRIMSTLMIPFLNVHCLFYKTTIFCSYTFNYSAEAPLPAVRQMFGGGAYGVCVVQHYWHQCGHQVDGVLAQTRFISGSCCLVTNNTNLEVILGFPRWPP